MQIEVPQERIEAFCLKWKVKEFALFGSVLTEEFRADSDVDVLVDFSDDATWTLWDWDDMVGELEAIFQRPVDLANKPFIRNPFRRHSILSSSRVVYAAG